MGQVCQHRAELFERVEVVHGEEVVDVGQGGLHASGQGLIGVVAQERVEPDQAVAVARQAGHFSSQQFGVAPVAAVADDEHDAATAQHTPQPAIVEFLDRLADARAAGPVVDHHGRSSDGVVDVAAAQVARDARQAGAEDEALDAVEAVRDGVHKVQQHARIRLHRPADVAQHDDGARLFLRPLEAQVEQFAVVAQAPPDRRAQVQQAAFFARRAPPHRPRLDGPAHLPDKSPGRGHLFRGEFGEVFLAQHLGGAVRGEEVDLRRFLFRARRPRRGVLLARLFQRLLHPLALPWRRRRVDLGQQHLHRFGQLRRRPPEQMKRLIEEIDLIAPPNEDAEEGLVDVILAPDADDLDGPDGVHDLMRADL